jgi:hypothetical protein
MPLWRRNHEAEQQRAFNRRQKPGGPDRDPRGKSDVQQDRAQDHQLRTPIRKVRGHCRQQPPRPWSAWVIGGGHVPQMVARGVRDPGRGFGSQRVG